MSDRIRPRARFNKLWPLTTFAVTVLGGCTSSPKEADLGALYDVPAQRIGDDRTPVVVLPGMMGSKIVNIQTGQKIWGSFTYGAADADNPQGAREFALPMVIGTPLSQLRDDGVPSGVLDYVVVDLGPFRDIKIGAYVDIMMMLAAGKYRDQSLGESGAIDYGGQHYTCFQYPYDWRRDISESAAALHAHIQAAQEAVRHGRGLDSDTPVKVDVVAHSMGGLVLRYYLRYGSTPLPDDGSIPPVTWAGAKHVRRAFFVGTPSAGSAEALVQLVEGLNLNPVFPNYRPNILGTFPSVYQLFTRTRHNLVRDAETGETIDLLDVEVWKQYQWGLADSEDDEILSWLLPDTESSENRRAIALDHLEKCLDRADQLFRALDVPALPPAGMEMFLFAGDGEDTPAVLAVDDSGRITVAETAPGDGTVTRSSALMDERVGGEWTVGLRSPIAWERIQFISASHLGLTKHPSFSNNILFLMLESPTASDE